MARVLEGRNRANADEMASFVDKYEELEKEKLREKMTYMERCRRISEQQKELLDDAKSQGLPKNVMRGVVKLRDLQRKIEFYRGRFRR
ncbi:GapR family DNA-binding domain-containing protein [Rhizobium laguerreae]